ncbi:MAG TPA: DUF3037 domain-containing protein [Clostridiaceae bacterium]
MAKIKYSIFSHQPSIYSKEWINLGILFYNVSENTYKFEYTTSWDKVIEFNAELDLDFLKTKLLAIKNEIESKNFILYKCNCIEVYIKFYVNVLKFSKITLEETDDYESFINEIKGKVLTKVCSL